MDLQVNDMVVIVTGAAAGIGQATAALLTAEGAVVVGVDRDDVESGLGRDGTAIRADLTDVASAPRIVESVMQRYGRIDGLVNKRGRAAAPQRLPQHRRRSLARCVLAEFSRCPSDEPGSAAADARG
jgi:NAD(P)-dependent dehydrogenase (short-subunit alcohol dehydrogenase family)